MALRAGFHGTVGQSSAQIIDGSLKFDGGYLTRTPSSVGNRRTFTWSAWIKRSDVSSRSAVWGAGTTNGSNNPGGSMYFDSSTGTFRVVNGGGTVFSHATSASLRDTGWYHVVVAINTAGTPRVAIYINGEHATASGTIASQNFDLDYNNTIIHAIGTRTDDGSLPASIFNGHMSQVYLIDGQALGPENFGFTDPLTNTWRPKKFVPTKINDGTTWSSNVTGNIYGGSAANVFDGEPYADRAEINSSDANDNHFTLSSMSVRASKVGVYVSNSGSNIEVSINGSVVGTISSGDIDSSSKLFSFTFTETTVTSIKVRRVGSTSGWYIYGIDLNDVHLLDGDTSNMGLNGFYLPMDGNSPIGEDKSGRGNNWTPVNFGSSNSIEKATGALPILNTVNGGNVATAGIRTDTAPGNGPVGVSTHLVLALPLDNIANDVHHIVKGSGSAKTITVNGNAVGVTTESNFYGGSFYFDGSGDYLQTADSSDFTVGSGDYTIEGWFYPENVSSTRRLCGQRASDASELQFLLEISSSGVLSYYFSISNSSYEVQGDALAANRWYHIAVTRNGNVHTLYVNGQSVGTRTQSGTLDDRAQPFSIGRQGNYTSDTFDGYIQDFRFYKGVAKYTSNFIPAATSPDILPDTPSGVSGKSKLTKITEGAVSFDGTGDYLQIPNHADLRFGSGAFCVEAFVYYSETSGNGTIAGLWNSGSNRRSWLFQIESDNRRLRGFFSSNGSTVTQVNGSTGQMTRNAWHHVAFTRSGNDFRVFLDGVEVGSATSSNSLYDNSDDDIGVGSAQGGASSDPITGFISNVRIVKGSAVYTSDFTPPAAPLSNITNTKLLCSQSTVSATAAAVIPTGSITANGDAAATEFNPFNTDINTVRGQETGYCTLNPLAFGKAVMGSKRNTDVTFSDGNLTSTVGATNNREAVGDTVVSSGKYYFEAMFDPGGNGDNSDGAGWVADSGLGVDNSTNGGFCMLARDNGSTVIGNGNSRTDETSGTHASFNRGDVMGCAIDLDSRIATWYKNGGKYSFEVDFSSRTNLDGQDFKPMVLNRLTGSVFVNFGQKPFKFPPPDGFQPLTATNTLPSTVIARPDQYFDTKLYTGTTESPRTISGLSMTPDMVWVKNRTDDSTGHYLFDTVRGDNQNIRSDGDFTQSAVSAAAHGIISTIGKNSFTVKDGSGSGNNVGSTGSDNYVAWCWKAGGNESTFNVDGVGYATASAAGLTCTADLVGASVGTKQGFSIIRYQATSGETVAHGLSQQPGCIFMKNLDTSGDWNVYHRFGGDGDYMANNEVLNLNNADPMSASGSNTFITGTSATTFTVGSSSIVQNGSDDFIAYIWHDVPGLQKFGHWKANNSTDGNFLNLGFRPGLIIAKQVSGSGSDKQWFMLDSKRNTTNPINNIVDANKSDNERQATIYDLTSNGAKIRIAFASNEHFIYMAWAETATNNLYGAQANAR
jgi:hypothetical protein